MQRIYRVRGARRCHVAQRLEQIAADRRTPAEEKLERFHAAWDGKVDPVFQEFAF